MTERVPLWVDLRAVPVRKRLPFLRAAAGAGVERILLASGDPHLERRDALRVDGRNHLRDGTDQVGAWIHVRSGRDQARAAAATGLAIVEAADWKVIPLENLIAARKGPLYAVADTPQQALLWRDTLEHGPDGIVLRPQTAAEIEEADRLLRLRGPRPPRQAAPEHQSAAPAPPRGSGPGGPRGRTAPAGPPRPGAARARPPAAPAGATVARQAPPRLVPARVTQVTDAGPGDRVCIDTTSLFVEGEGLLLGSTAASACLVAAETAHNAFVAPRPFRVNAGAVHLYVHVPGGRTRYLSELRAGDHVLAVHPRGARVLTIGRCKVERRPHVLVSWDAGGVAGSAMLQNAETVRLVAPRGTLPVTSLQAGDTILVHPSPPGRHFGMAVDESIEER